MRIKGHGQTRQEEASGKVGPAR